jgi:DNA polymerase IV
LATEPIFGISLRHDDFKIATRDQTAQAYIAAAKTTGKMAGLRLQLLRTGEVPACEQNRPLAQSGRAHAAT